jgi:hypothetical protein
MRIVLGPRWPPDSVADTVFRAGALHSATPIWGVNVHKHGACLFFSEHSHSGNEHWTDLSGSQRPLFVQP